MRCVRRADKNTGDGEIIVQERVGSLMDLLVYHESLQRGSNPCKVNNGGCAHLCLYANGQANCACPSQYSPTDDGSECLEPRQFLLFAQRNRISRLVSGMTTKPTIGAANILFPTLFRLTVVTMMCPTWCCPFASPDA